MFFGKISSAILNFLCPPRCPICHNMTEEPHTLCPSCYAKLNFITQPCCEICGRPFEYAGLNKLICGKCMKKKPKFSMARSVLEYTAFSKKLILAFKHGDHLELTPLFAKFMLQADKKIFEEVDLIVPVPLHWTRLFLRKYNQATLLGRAIGRKRRIPFSEVILKRTRATSSQGHKHRQEREKNVKNAFCVTNPKKVCGKTILVIDDVMTTGATLNECAKTLLKAGAKSVKVLTIYRVITL